VRTDRDAVGRILEEVTRSVSRRLDRLCNPGVDEVSGHTGHFDMTSCTTVVPNHETDRFVWTRRTTTPTSRAILRRAR
jgi:hypothetical protein